MDERHQELLRIQQARQQAEEAIRDLAKTAESAEGGTYLVSDFRRRDDLPATASLRRMSNAVAKKLAELGFRDPVSLQSIPNRWWKVKVDAAEVGLVSEYGCAMVTRMLSTDELRETGFEVEDGPFRDWENDEVSRAILNQYPGSFWDARILRVDTKPGHNGWPTVLRSERIEAWLCRYWRPMKQVSASPTEFAPGLVIRGIAPPLKLRDFKLIAFDMDSTLINIECVDEIADAVGRKDEVAAITEAAMRGEIADFKDSLRRRVALLRGVTVADMDRVFTERLRINPGAAELIAACKAAGLKVLLVSGGFTFFADRVQARLGIDFARSNILEIEAGPHCGALTGRLVNQCWGDICDGAEKRRTLLEVASLLGAEPQQCIAVGDGANDLAMMGVAGLSVAYRAKPKVRDQAMVAINDGGLERLLEVVQPG